MKRAWWLLAMLLLLTSTLALAQEPKVMPQLVVQARFVYVTSYDGPSWSGDVLPEDRKAIVDVENALRKWGKYTLVYEPEKADLVFVVQKRGSEDVLAVYDAQHPGVTTATLWRGMQRGGLDAPEMSLVSRFEKSVEAATEKK